MLNTNRFKLYKDNYNIYNLITKINSGYRLYFDQFEKLFVIVNIANNDEICMKFKSFTVDIINQLQKSRIEYANKIFSEIEEYNHNIEYNNYKNSKTKIADFLAETNHLSKRKGTLYACEINKIFEGKNA